MEIGDCRGCRVEVSSSLLSMERQPSEAAGPALAGPVLSLEKPT